MVMRVWVDVGCLVGVLLALVLLGQALRAWAKVGQEVCNRVLHIYTLHRCAEAYRQRSRELENTRRSA